MTTLADAEARLARARRAVRGSTLAKQEAKSAGELARATDDLKADLDEERAATQAVQELRAAEKAASVDAQADQLFGAIADYIDRRIAAVLGEGGAARFPQHEWDGTSIRFESAPGVWGQWVNLQGQSARLTGFSMSALSRAVNLDAGSAVDGSNLNGGGAAGGTTQPGFGGGGASATFDSDGTMNAGRAG